MKKKHIFILILIGITLIACAGANPSVDTPDDEGKLAGFGQGFWHGFCAGINLVLSIFGKDRAIYDVHNNGIGYDWGFFIGLLTIYGTSLMSGRGES